MDTSQTSEEHLTLRAGAFYWVILTFDPDAELWANERMPALFAGYVGGEPT
jgi:hypothetical protein